MPIPMILIAAAIGFVVILCVVLWLTDVTGGTDTDNVESMAESMR